jgi:polyferredoxin
MKGYAAVLIILTGTLIGMLFLRNDLEATILRLPGQLYQRIDNNMIRNVYTYKLINKTTHEVDNVSFKLLSHPGEITFVTGPGFQVPAENLAEGTVFVDIKTGTLNGDQDKLEIGVFSGDKLIETASVRFLAPRTYK